MTLPDEDPPALLLRLSGPPLLHGAGGRSLALERKAAGALLWLALRGPVLRERLAQLLWPQAGDTGARNSLRQLIFKLKKAMDASVIDGSEELALAPGVRLAPDLPTSRLLEGCEFADCPEFAAFLDAARAAHRQQDQARRLAAAARAEAEGELEQALALARALVAEDPLCEAAHRQLVRALYLRGERAAALAAGQACEDALREGLGVPPAAETLALIDSVRQADTPRPAAAMPVTVLRPPRLVGRERERTQLLQALAEGRIALLLGEPGLGKSRLLAETTAAGGLVVAARPGDAGVPFATLARLLRALLARQPQALAGAFGPTLPPPLQRVLPELSAPPLAAAADPGQPRLDLQRVVALLLAHAAPAQVALDDLHFADEASIELLHALLDDEALGGWRWALAQRPAEGGAAARRLAQALADDGRLQPLPLQPLNEAQVAELVASLGLPGLDAGALAPALTRRTGGNPMFVLETLKALLAEGADGSSLPRPRSVGAMIERRLQQLSSPALALARVAALAGPDFSTDLAVHVLGTPLMALADAWAELEAAQVLRDNAFAHDLIYETTLAGVPQPIRRHARRAIAEFLEPRNAEPARLAEHWLAAAEPARAAGHFKAAAARAEAAVRYDDARQLLEHAARCQEDAGQPDAALDTRLRLAGLLSEAGRHDQALSLLRELQAAQARIDARLRVSVELMHSLSQHGRPDEALAMGQALLADEALLEDAAPQAVAELRHACADLLLDRAQTGEALAQLELVRERFSTCDDAQRRAWFHNSYGRALQLMGEVGRAERSYAAALDSARRNGRRRLVAGVLQYSASASQTAGRLVETLDLLEEAQRLIVEGGEDTLLAHAMQVMAAREQQQLGRYAQALARIEPLMPRLPVNWQVNAQVVLALAWAGMGQPARARAALKAGHAAGQGPAQRALLSAGIEAAWVAGQPHDELLDALAALGPGHPMTTWRATLLRWRAHPEQADAAEAATLRARFEATGLLGLALMADLLACQRAGAAGQHAVAAQLGARALRALRHATMPDVYRGALWHGLWQGLRDADTALATQALREGADWVQAVARFHVPEALRDGFLRRNRFNAEMLAAARSLAGPAGGR